MQAMLQYWMTKYLKTAGIKLSIKHAFGSNTTRMDPIQAYSVPSISTDRELSEKVIFRVGKQLCVYDSETNQEQFLQKSKKVKNILHFILSPNNRFVSVCESVCLDKDDEGYAEIGIYNLLTMARYKTLTYQSATEFVLR
jgi:hypothetical protein